MFDTVTALDIGASSLKAVEARSAFGRHPQAVRAASIPLEEGIIEDGGVVDELALGSSIKELWRRGGFHSNRVVVGFDGPKVIVRAMTLPMLPINLLRESLQVNVMGKLPLSTDHYIMDFLPVEKSKTHGSVDGFVVAMDVDTSNLLATALTRANLSVLRMDSTPFAIARTFQPFYGGRTTAVVSIGSTTTTMIVVDAHGIPRFIRSVPEGGHDITESLMNQMNMDHGTAEGLKRSIGLAPVKRTAGMGEKEYAVRSRASGLIRKTTADIITRIRNSIRYYLESDAGLKIERLIVTGGVAGMRGMVRSVGLATGIPVDQSFLKSRRGAVKMGMKNEKTLGMVMDHYDGFTTAFGLLLGPRP